MTHKYSSEALTFLYHSLENAFNEEFGDKIFEKEEGWSLFML